MHGWAHILLDIENAFSCMIFATIVLFCLLLFHSAIHDGHLSTSARGGGGEALQGGAAACLGGRTPCWSEWSPKEGPV